MSRPCFGNLRALKDRSSFPTKERVCSFSRPAGSGVIFTR